MKVQDKIFEKYWEGERTYFKLSDLPEDLQPDDCINFERDEGYYSENNSWDPHTTLSVYREREETEDEKFRRKNLALVEAARRKKARREQYERLKLEFENDNDK